MKNFQIQIESLTQSLSETLRRHGIESFGFLDRPALERACRSLAPEIALDYGLDEARGALVAALHYDTTGAPAGTLDPVQRRGTEGRLMGALGWFARADWYGVLAEALGDAARDLRKAGNWTRRDFRVAVNSRLPEKPLAAAAGLGPLGRNSLLLERVSGPGCVLGILLLPFEPAAAAYAGEKASILPGSECGDCYECARACPTRAVDPVGGILRERCIQYWASTEAEVPAEIAESWRGNLYGCDLCLAACPRFRPGVERAAGRGFLGSGLALGPLLEASEEEIRGSLRDTALGLAWLRPQLLKRNALLAVASYIALEGPEILVGTDRAIMRQAERLSRLRDSPHLASAAGRVLGRAPV